MDLGLGGRAFLLTGASRGLGLATARVLAEEGALVTITGRSEERVRAAAQGLGPAALGVVADNGDVDAAQRAVEAAVDHGGGRLGGVLVSVGGPPPGGLLTVTDDTWRQEFETLVLGALRVVRTVLPHLADDGAIGFVLSSSVHNPIAGLGISNVLRPALAMAVKTLADELGPRGTRVVGLVPGTIMTDRVRDLSHLDGAEDPGADAPLGRAGTPEEFGRVAAFVLSPAASYLTGSLVTIDGGLTRSL